MVTALTICWTLLASQPSTTAMQAQISNGEGVLSSTAMIMDIPKRKGML